MQDFKKRALGVQEFHMILRLAAADAAADAAAAALPVAAAVTTGTVTVTVALPGHAVQTVAVVVNPGGGEAVLIGVVPVQVWVTV